MALMTLTITKHKEEVSRLQIYTNTNKLAVTLASTLSLCCRADVTFNKIKLYFLVLQSKS
jgi:hypothetical protein